MSQDAEKSYNMIYSMKVKLETYKDKLEAAKKFKYTEDQM